MKRVALVLADLGGTVPALAGSSSPRAVERNDSRVIERRLDLGPKAI
ncbi:hypothetical protein JFX10_02060 (plasmid) [Sinorhizobium meliloti]|nr:hypothetical protein JFX10_02060 [Sinorhizobium meliloti]